MASLISSACASSVPIPKPIPTPGSIDPVMFRGGTERTGYYQTVAIASPGRVRWRRPTGGSIYSSPAVWGNRLYTANNNGALVALDASSGAKYGLSSRPATPFARHPRLPTTPYLLAGAMGPSMTPISTQLTRPRGSFDGNSKLQVRLMLLRHFQMASSIAPIAPGTSTRFARTQAASYGDHRLAGSLPLLPPSVTGSSMLPATPARPLRSMPTPGTSCGTGGLERDSSLLRQSRAARSTSWDPQLFTL
ncbi:MAG: hypothetical protein E6H92_10300 [Chloroflexi bacterium]|nr:MAG: hypothetical protein E6H92_10300 [Chloroflexota bacterium]